MAQKKQKKKTSRMTEKYLNLPTRERMAQGGISISNNTARAEEPLRIDKLARGGVIDEMQHLYGVQIITLWTIANRPFLKAMQYEYKHGARAVHRDFINISRMSAEDQFHKTMGLLRVRDRELVRKICLEEMGAIEAGRSMGLPINSITVYVRAAFDALGDALARMRDLKKAIEAPVQEQQLAAEEA